MHESLVDLARTIREAGSVAARRRQRIELESVVAEHLRGKISYGTSGGKNLPDIIVDRGPSKPPLAVEVTVCEYHSLLANIGNRVAELQGESVRVHREFSNGVQLALMIVIVADADMDWHADQTGAMAVPGQLGKGLSPLMADGTAVGFHRIVVGLVGRGDVWFSVSRSGELYSEPGFRSASLRLADEPEPTKSDNDTVAVSADAGPTSQRLPRFLLIADEWKSGKGGISTLNRELAIALAKADVSVHVAVPSTDPGDRDQALASGISLVAPDPIPGVAGKQLLLTKPRFSEDAYSPDVIIGHGRVLGPYAYAVQNL